VAKTLFWICTSCGFINTPHAYRKGDANKACEQCGADQEKGVDSDPQAALSLKAGK
jgi:hypothetical protein